MTIVLHEKRGSAFWITINRADKRNALNAEVIAGIAEGYRLAQADSEVRALVITGAGEKAFCAGGDMQPNQGFSFDYSEPKSDYAQLLRLSQDCPLPTIARINGACMAGGMGLLCMTDLAVASESALFGLPEVKVGVFPFQVLALLQDLVAPRLLREWCLTGEPLDAGTALSWGLVNHVTPFAELDAKTEWLLARLTDKSPAAIRRGKYALHAMHSMSFDAAIAFAEGQIALMTLTEDAKEGVASFNERRRPRWTGR
jgi:methylglutaconyl-CoA hydratase